ATDSVARLSSAASGTIARTESVKRRVCASALSVWAANTTGTNTSSQRSGVWRMSLSGGGMGKLLVGSTPCGAYRRQRAPSHNHSQIKRSGLHACHHVIVCVTSSELTLPGRHLHHALDTYMLCE